MGKFDFGGAVGGAGSGAAIGAPFGAPGVAAGTVIGGLFGAFGRKKRKPKKISTLDDTQQGIYNDYAKGLNGQGKFADMFNFDEGAARDNWQQSYADPAYQNFNENVIPGITSQFRGAGLANSSYLGGALSKAGTDVQRNLDAHLSNMLYQGKNDSVNRRIDGINKLLNMQTFAYQQPQASAGDQAFGALLDAGGQAAGRYFDSTFGGNNSNQQPKPGYQATNRAANSAYAAGNQYRN